MLACWWKEHLGVLDIAQTVSLSNFVNYLLFDNIVFVPFMFWFIVFERIDDVAVISCSRHVKSLPEWGNNWALQGRNLFTRFTDSKKIKPPCTGYRLFNSTTGKNYLVSFTKMFRLKNLCTVNKQPQKSTAQ